jgi:hypothetical protein
MESLEPRMPNTRPSPSWDATIANLSVGFLVD